MNSLIQIDIRKLSVIAFAFTVMVASFAFALTLQNASAHDDPSACNASGLQQTPSIVSPAGSAYDGSVITYSVLYQNLDPDGAGAIAPCNLTGANGTILLPDGVTTINVLTNATLNVGDSISCPGGAGCAAGPYTYTVNHADENGSSSVTAVFNIAGVLHQDADEEFAADHDTLSKTVIHPTTITSIVSSAGSVLSGGSVDLTVTEQNDGDVDLTSPSVAVDNGVGVLGAPPTSGDDADGILEPGETWSWTVPNVVINSDTTFTATGRGLDPNSNNITWCADPGSPPASTICDQDEQDSVDVDVIAPTTITTISSSATTVSSGGFVTLTVTEQNDGDVDLTNAYVDVDNSIGTLNSTSTSFTGVDGGDIGVLDPGETWTWVLSSGAITASTTFTATGHGTDPLGNDVTFPADQDEQDSVTITVIAVEWCSPGYWRNHLSEAEAAAAAGGFLLSDPYSDFFDPVLLSKKAQKDGANANPSLWEVLLSPQWYGGEAFNNVGDLLSQAHPDVNFTIGNERVEDSCPLN